MPPMWFKLLAEGRMRPMMDSFDLARLTVEREKAIAAIAAVIDERPPTVLAGIRVMEQDINAEHARTEAAEAFSTSPEGGDRADRTGDAHMVHDRGPNRHAVGAMGGSLVCAGIMTAQKLAEGYAGG